jgi:hypothetical protein
MMDQLKENHFLKFVGWIDKQFLIGQPMKLFGSKFDHFK